jgi:hypothetical protein
MPLDTLMRAFSRPVVGPVLTVTIHRGKGKKTTTTNGVRSVSIGPQSAELLLATATTSAQKHGSDWTSLTVTKA